MTKVYNPLLDELNKTYTWEDVKVDGRKNPRARKKKRLTDQEYLLRLEMRDNETYLYAQGEKFKED